MEGRFGRLMSVKYNVAGLESIIASTVLLSIFMREMLHTRTFTGRAGFSTLFLGDFLPLESLGSSLDAFLFFLGIVGVNLDSSAFSIPSMVGIAPWSPIAPPCENSNPLDFDESVGFCDCGFPDI